MSQEAFQTTLIAFIPNRKELSWWFDSYNRVWPGNYYCRQLLPNFFNRPSGYQTKSRFQKSVSEIPGIANKQKHDICDLMGS